MIAERRFEGRQVAPEQLLEWNQQWADLIEAFKKARHQAPDHADVQALAAQMFALIRIFTQGDPAIRGVMERMWSERDPMPAEYTVMNTDLMTFMNQALTIYEQNRGESA